MDGVFISYEFLGRVIKEWESNCSTIEMEFATGRDQDFEPDELKELRMIFLRHGKEAAAV